MAFTASQLRTIESTLTLWKVSYRPEERLRDQVDLDYSVKGQDIFLEEVRPVFSKPGEIGRYPFAKIKFEKTTELWKIYWMRGNLKWYQFSCLRLNQKLLTIESISKSLKMGFVC